MTLEKITPTHIHRHPMSIPFVIGKKVIAITAELKG
jgi:hypothetical protein